MPSYSDFSMGYVDGSLTVGLSPPDNIQGWSIRFSMMKRNGGTPFLYAYAASGYNNVSGIQITNFTIGTMVVSLPQSSVSGQDPGAYYYVLERTDSGSAGPLVQGYRVMWP